MDKRRLFPAVVVVFINLLGATIVLPILPLFVVEMLEGTVVHVVLLDSSYYAAKMVAAPILGRLSDAYGRRPLLIFSQMGTVLSFVLFAAAIPLGQQLEQSGLIAGLSGGLVLLFIARLLDGATGGNTIVAQAYVVDVTDEDHRAQALGYLSAALGLGFIIGPALGGILAAWLGLMGPFVFGALAAGIGLVCTILLLEESNTQKGQKSQRNKAAEFSLRTAFFQPGFARVAAIGFLTTVCFAAISPTFSLYARRVLFDNAVTPEVVGRSVGFIFMLVGLVMVATQGLLIRPLVKTWGEKKLLVMVQGLLLLAFLAIPTVTHPGLAAVLMMPLAFAYSVSDPSLQALVTQTGSEQTKGQLLGAYHSALSLAYLLGPLWGGLVFERVAPQALWWVGAVLLLPSFLVSIWVARQRPYPATTPAKAVSFEKSSAPGRGHISMH